MRDLCPCVCRRLRCRCCRRRRRRRRLASSRVPRLLIFMMCERSKVCGPLVASFAPLFACLLACLLSRPVGLLAACRTLVGTSNRQIATLGGLLVFSLIFSRNWHRRPKSRRLTRRQPPISLCSSSPFAVCDRQSERERSDSRRQKRGNGPVVWAVSDCVGNAVVLAPQSELFRTLISLRLLVAFDCGREHGAKHQLSAMKSNRAMEQ